MNEEFEQVENPNIGLQLQLHHFEHVILDMKRVADIAASTQTPLVELFWADNFHLLKSACQQIAAIDGLYWSKLADRSYRPTLEDVIQRAQSEARPEYADELTGVGGIKRTEYEEARTSNMLKVLTIPPNKYLLLNEAFDDFCLYTTQITPPGFPAPHCHIQIPKILELGKPVNGNFLWYTTFSELVLDDSVPQSLRDCIIIQENSILVMGLLVRDLGALKIIDKKSEELRRRYIKRQFIK